MAKAEKTKKAPAHKASGSIAVKKKAKMPEALPKKPKHLLSALKMPRPNLLMPLEGGSSKLPARVQEAIDKIEIAEVVYTFARGIDRLDETLLRTVCHPDATIDLGPGVFQGMVNDYIVWLLGVMQQVRSTHNLIGNVRAQIDGDTALVESYVQTHHRLDKPTGREDVFLGGRFLDRMERRPSGVSGVWKIVHRKHLLDWTRTEAVSEIFYHQNPDALWSYRTKVDWSYQMAQASGQGGGKTPSFLGTMFETKSIKF